MKDIIHVVVDEAKYLQTYLRVQIPQEVHRSRPDLADGLATIQLWGGHLGEKYRVIYSQ